MCWWSRHRISVAWSSWHRANPCHQTIGQSSRIHGRGNENPLEKMDSLSRRSKLEEIIISSFALWTTKLLHIVKSGRNDLEIWRRSEERYFKNEGSHC